MQLMYKKKQFLRMICVYCNSKMMKGKKLIVVLDMKIRKILVLLKNSFVAYFILIGFNIDTNAQFKINVDTEFQSINYKDLKNWAAHPDKKDLSDSNNIYHKENDKIKAHVFFLHPTTYTGKIKNNNWNADINDKELNDKTDKSSILYQSTAFKNQTIIFAPRYRQAHIDVFYIEKELSDTYFEIAYQDVKDAFQEYLLKYNNGYPIIIASHSQGTKHAGRLLKEFFDNKPLKEKLVCAYIIGMPIPSNYFSDLKPCDQENKTGCFVGWRTYKQGYVPLEVKNENFKCLVVNPLSWNLDSVKINKGDNEGGILLNFTKKVPNVVDAEIHNNILWSCKPDVPGKFFFTKKNFHIGDINLFYGSIFKNVGTRIKAFLKED